MSGRWRWWPAIALGMVVLIAPAKVPASEGDPRLVAASGLRVSQNWSRDPATLRAGDTVVRSIVVEAHGVRAMREPLVYFPYVAGISVTAEPAVVQTKERRDGLAQRSVHRFHVRIDTTRPIEFGQIYVPWFSIPRDEQRLASLGRLFVSPGQRSVDELRVELAQSGAWWLPLQALLPHAGLALAAAAAILVAGVLLLLGRDGLATLPDRWRRWYRRQRVARQLRTAARRGSATAFYWAARRWLALGDGRDDPAALRAAFAEAGLSAADCRQLEAAAFATARPPALAPLARRLLHGPR